MTTVNKLSQRTQSTHLCIGLDPDPNKIPLAYNRFPDPIMSFLLDAVQKTYEYAAAYKLNTAFFEALGPSGWKTLHKFAHDFYWDYPEIPLIIDGKRCDVGHTAVAYAKAIYEELAADSTTVLPFFGEEGLTPFLAYPDKLTFVVVHSSNPGGYAIQKAARPFIANTLMQPAMLNAGLVCPGTNDGVIHDWRHLLPNRWMLIPGIGAQGGDLEAAVKAAGHNFLVSVSRGILYGENGFHEEARAYRDRIQQLLAA